MTVDTILLATVATRAHRPKHLDCGRKPFIHCNTSLSLLSVAYRLRHFVKELRLRYVQSLSHLSATDDQQYARLPTREIKLPAMRLHHRCAQVRKMQGQRAFNHACFTGPPRLVKCRWPLMTEEIGDMMKCNGPRGKRGHEVREKIQEQMGDLNSQILRQKRLFFAHK